MATVLQQVFQVWIDKTNKDDFDQWFGKNIQSLIDKEQDIILTTWEDGYQQAYSDMNKEPRNGYDALEWNCHSWYFSIKDNE